MSYVFNPLTGKLDRVGGSWSAITGKPNTFPPSAHTHLWSHILDAPPDSVVVKLAPATTDLVLGAYPAIPSFPATVTISSIRADVDTPPEGSSIIIDMLRNNVSVLNNKLTINPTKTSTADSTPAPSFIPDGNQFSYGDKISFQVMQVGAINPGKGLTITLNGVKISAIDATNTLVLYNLKINTALDPGETGNDKFKLPLYSGYTYNFTIDWGDGYTETWTSSSSPIHQYTTPGVYYIKITGVFPGFLFRYTLERKKVLEVHLRDLPLQSLADSFSECPNLIKVSGTTVTATQLNAAWYSCTGLTSFPNISFPNGSNFSWAWYSCTGLTSFPNISFPNGSNFDRAWAGCTGLTSFPNISFPNGSNFSHAWYSCTGLTSFPNISFPNGSNFDRAWYNCTGLTSFPNISFPNGSNFSHAWAGCTGLTSFPNISFPNGSNFSWAWYSCTGLTSFPNISFPNGSNFDRAWAGCTGLTSFPNISFPNGSNFSHAWYSCTGLTSFPNISFPNGSNFDRAWYNCTGLTSFPNISFPNGSNFSHAWAGCTGLTSFPNISFPNGSNFSWAWYSCTGLTSFPAGVFDNWQGTPVEGCFRNTWHGCSLTAQSVENILVSIDTSGREAQASWSNDGREITISYNTATGALSTATTNAITSLKNKNWIIRINGVIQ